MKLCKDCKHSQANGTACVNPKLCERYWPSDGSWVNKPLSTATARDKFWLCGYEGHWFEPKESPPYYEPAKCPNGHTVQVAPLNGGTSFVIMCCECYWRGEAGRTRREAIEKWNSVMEIRDV